MYPVRRLDLCVWCRSTLAEPERVGSRDHVVALAGCVWIRSTPTGTTYMPARCRWALRLARLDILEPGIGHLTADTCGANTCYISMASVKPRRHISHTRARWRSDLPGRRWVTSRREPPTCWVRQEVKDQAGCSEPEGSCAGTFNQTSARWWGGCSLAVCLV